MTLHDFLKLNKQVLEMADKCYDLFEKLGWKKDKFSFVNKAEEEADKMMATPLEDLKKKKEELGSQAFSAWLRRPMKTLKNLEERYAAWNKLYEMKIEDEKKEAEKKKNLKEDILGLSEENKKGVAVDYSKKEKLYKEFVRINQEIIAKANKLLKRPEGAKFEAYSPLIKAEKDAKAFLDLLYKPEAFNYMEEARINKIMNIVKKSLKDVELIELTAKRVSDKKNLKEDILELYKNV